MATADEFVRVSALLSQLVPDADIGGIELKGGGDAQHNIIVHTREARRMIGSGGRTIQGLRDALAKLFADDLLTLSITEIPEEPPPDERPPDGPGVMYPPD
jgi:ribosomal protein S3